jgi:hypothetical protein
MLSKYSFLYTGAKVTILHRTAFVFLDYRLPPAYMTGQNQNRAKQFLLDKAVREKFDPFLDVCFYISALVSDQPAYDV